MCRTDAADRRSASPLNSQEMTVSWGKLGRSFLFALNEQTNNADDDHAELIKLCEAGELIEPMIKPSCSPTVFGAS